MSKIEQIVRGLTLGRKALILALPADGSWGRTPERRVAVRLGWSKLPCIIQHKHRPDDANEWALSDFGIAVRQHLDREGVNRE